MEQNALFDEITQHVEAIPIVKNLFDKVRTSKLLPLWSQYHKEFFMAPAATSHHHNFTHGLIIHTAEVWEAAQKYLAAAPHSQAYDDALKNDVDNVEGGKVKEHQFWFSPDELFTVVFLHDFAKIIQYKQSGNYTWKFDKMICNQEAWTLRELARMGIKLTDNELVGLLGAEGGYSEFDVEWRPISAIMHGSDLWSSQAMAAFWDPAKEQDIKCKICNEPMRLINGPKGPFYGCTGYPSCKSTMNTNELPPVEQVFLNFLQKNYPLPA